MKQFKYNVGQKINDVVILKRYPKDHSYGDGQQAGYLVYSDDFGEDAWLECQLEREEIESLALKTISPDLYYDLQDIIEGLKAAFLTDLILCKGDIKREQVVIDEWKLDIGSVNKIINQ